MKIRAKMKVESVTKTCYNTEGHEQVKLMCFYSNNKEDNSFSKATPSGNCTLEITNPDILGTFVPGSFFYLDFTPVPDGVK